MTWSRARRYRPRKRLAALALCPSIAPSFPALGAYRTETRRRSRPPWNFGSVAGVSEKTSTSMPWTLEAEDLVQDERLGEHQEPSEDVTNTTCRLRPQHLPPLPEGRGPVCGRRLDWHRSCPGRSGADTSWGVERGANALRQPLRAQLIRRDQVCDPQLHQRASAQGLLQLVSGSRALAVLSETPSSVARRWRVGGGP